MQQIYGEEFNVDTLEDGLLNSLVRNEIVGQKALLFQAQQMKLINSEEEAKRLIMSEPSFQTDGRFNQDICNEICKNKYNIQSSSLKIDYIFLENEEQYIILFGIT